MANFQDKSTFSGGVVLTRTVTNVHDTTPTAVELTTACPGMQQCELRMVDDAAGGVSFYLVTSSNGTDRFYLKFVKAL